MGVRKCERERKRKVRVRKRKGVTHQRSVTAKECIRSWIGNKAVRAFT